VVSPGTGRENVAAKQDEVQEIYMSYRKATVVSPFLSRFGAIALMAGLIFLVAPGSAIGQKSKTTAAPKASAPASHSSSTTTGHSSATTGAHPGATGSAASRPAVGTTRNENGGTTTRTASGKEVIKSPAGNVTSIKTASGHEAMYDSHGSVKEVHSGNTTVSRGPNGVRRTEVERADHSRVVAYGHGRGYVQHEYEYGGHHYYSRAYYYHGGYYRGYYRPYYYGGVYLYGYVPAYYYPAAYYGWAYSPWGTPVAYGWGWSAAPWYGAYGAYFAPYPEYPSAAYWLTDYMVASSLADAYATSAASGDSAHLRPINPARLVYASYNPDTGTTSPTMTKEVKDAVADEIKLELALGQKVADPANGSTANLETLLADGKPHVFVASTGLTVSSSGADCGLTEGDVLALNKPPAKDDTTADLRVLASKQNDCAKGSVVTAELTDLQEMLNHLLSNIDKGMAQMKDHPGQGGLPAPPAEAISGTKEAPYAAAAPAADASGAAEVDETAKQGAQVEQQVVAEASAPDSSDASAQTPSPIGGLAPSQPVAPAAPKGPAVIALGQTQAEVIATKGQPTNKVAFPNKTVFIYPDMKITFVNGKLSDVQ
jgi:hypothetical protein